MGQNTSNQATSDEILFHLRELQQQGIHDMKLKKKSQKNVAPIERTKIPGETLQMIRDDIGNCKRCRLCETRQNIVFGDGNPKAELMFIGEAPGADEDDQGIPFVGRACQLLTKMIIAMGFERKDVYIANIVKCRPPDNRYPEQDESDTCSPFLYRQIDAIKPKIIVSLGNLATQTLLQTKTGITVLHGQFVDFEGTTLMPTYHPAFLLRNPNMKKPCWEDLQKVMKFLGKPVK